MGPVKLHGPHDPVLLGRNTNKKQPVLSHVAPVVNDLNSRRTKVKPEPIELEKLASFCKEKIKVALTGLREDRARA